MTKRSSGNNAPGKVARGHKARVPQSRKNPPDTSRFHIDLPDPAVRKLRAIVDRDNANNGTDYTLTGWIVRRLLETAVADQLAATAHSLQEQAQADATRQLQDAIANTRDSLIEELEVDPKQPQGGTNGPD